MRKRRYGTVALQVGCLLLGAGFVYGQSVSRMDYDRFDRRTHPRAHSNSGDHSALDPRQSAYRRRVTFRRDMPLTPPRSADAETIGRDYLSRLNRSAQRKTAPAVDWTLTARYESPKAKLTHLVFEPQRAGVGFFDSHATVHVDDKGRIQRVDEAPPGYTAGYLTVTLSQRQAVEAAVAKLFPDAKLSLGVETPEAGADRRVVLSGSGLRSPATVRLVWFRLKSQTLAAWEMLIDLSEQGAYLVVVAGNSGEILFSRNLTQALEPWGKVFRAPDRPNPTHGVRMEEPLSGWPSAGGLCPAEIYPAQFRLGALEGLCWIEGDETVGNNVDACRDVDANNVCDARASGPLGEFDFAFSDSYAATSNPVPDREAALTNAFYWTNVAHDWLHGLGFDEAAGNFQADNFGRGGAGGDPVRLDVEDGSVPGNATFFAPPDGIAARMQLGLYASTRRDSAFDGDIMIHEYIHGLSSRLVGGPSDATGLFLWHSGAMGEGWSDAYAASFTDDPVVGEYVTGNPTTGLRTVSYDNSPYTFGDIGTLFLKVVPGTGRLLRIPQVHRDGEIWASVLWDLRLALGADNFEQVLTTGLKLTPSRPSMLDARDAIVQAAQLLGVGGSDGCAIWSVFASRGFGASAALNPIEAVHPNDTALSIFEAFDLPATCGGTQPVEGVTLLYENAEAGGAGWEVTGLWHVSTRRAASGSHSWWFGQEGTGDYDTGARVFGTLTSPPIDLAGVSGAMVKWDQYFDGEGFGAAVNLGSASGAYLNADSGRLMISVDDGASWRTISHLAHDTVSFAHYKVNLSRYAGQMVRLRFDFDTFDASWNTQEGWFVDDIRVSALGAAAAPSPPIAEWFFDEAAAGSGVTVSDASGNGRDGLTQSFGTIAAPGVLGNARRLNGSTDAIDFGSASTFTPPSFTISTWVRVESYPTSLGTILSAYGGNYHGWWLGLNADGHVLFLGAKQPTTAQWLSSTSPLALERWHHLAVTYDHAAQQASLYVDGSLNAQSTIAGLDPETALPLVAGKASWFAGYYLDFSMDETRIYAYVRGPSEIAADFAALTPQPPPVETTVKASWSFENGGEDGSGNGHSGALNGTTVEPGVSGAARHFDGVNDSMTIPWSPRLTPSRFTLRTWVKLDSHPAGLGVLFANYGGNFQGWYIAVQPDGRLLFSTNRLPSVSRGVLSASALALDRWSHVSVTYDGLTQQAAIYLDGVLEGQAHVGGITPQDSGIVSIGKASWYNGYHLAFSIDETQLLRQVWTPDEVEEDFVAFPGRPRPNPSAVWTFDDAGQGPGVVLADSSTNGHNATTAGAGTNSVTGNFGAARAFDGFSDHATLAPHVDLSTDAFSLTAWIKLPAHPGGWGVIFSNYGGDYRGWFCGVNSSGRLVFSVSGLPTQSSWLVSNTPLELDRWYHVAFTFGDLIRRGAIYIDGALDRSAVFGGFTPQTTVQPTFGRASWYNGAYLGVVMDTARLYTEELTASEVVADRAMLP